MRASTQRPKCNEQTPRPRRTPVTVSSTASAGLDAPGVLRILDGYWERVGDLRASLLSKGRKAKLADSLIAQVCLDHEALLIERDSDYQAFSELAGLKLALPRSP